MTLLHQMAEVVRDLKELNVINNFWVSYRQEGKNGIVFSHGNSGCSSENKKTIEHAINEAFSGYKIVIRRTNYCIFYEISCQ